MERCPCASCSPPPRSGSKELPWLESEVKPTAGLVLPPTLALRRGSWD